MSSVMVLGSLHSKSARLPPLTMEVASPSRLSMLTGLRLFILSLTLGLLPALTGTADAADLPDVLSLGVHFVSIRGARIRYDVAGSGPLLVIQAPGWGVGSSYLRKGLSPLEASFTVVTYDPRNSGGSDRVREPAHLTDSQMVEDLEALRETWNIQTFFLLGHSNGGAIALAYTESYPGHVAKLVLAGTEGPALLATSDRKALDQRRENDVRFKDAYRHLNDPTDSDSAFLENLRQTLPLYLSDPTLSLQEVAATLPDRVSVSSTAVYEQEVGKQQLPPLSATDRVRIPVLLLVGVDDWPCTPEPSRQIHARIKGSVLHVYPHAGHFTWIERPDLFFPDVTKFLRSAS